MNLENIFKIKNNQCFNYYNQTENIKFPLNSTLCPILIKQKYNTFLKLCSNYIPKSMRESNYLKLSLGRENNQKGVWEKDGNKINE